MKIKKSSCSVFELIGLLLLSTIMTVSVASAQVVEQNVNVSGTPVPFRYFAKDENGDPIGLDGQLIYQHGWPGRQENEPSCGKDPRNDLHILCAYNWYGFADPVRSPEGALIDAQNDAWIAVSETIDGGRTWFRHPLPGTKLNNPISVFEGDYFAADPTVNFFPGGAFITAIVGKRGGNSAMVVWRMMQRNLEGQIQMVAEASPKVAKLGTGIHFIDKPDSQIIPDRNGGFSPVTMTLEERDPETGLNIVVEDRLWPNFQFVISYADFGGSGQNIRTWSITSNDFAESFKNATQISNTSGLDQGLSIENKGDDFLYVWRRFDSGEGRASIVGAHKRGKKIGKPFEITEVCEFDQETAPSPLNPDRASVRSLAFPWLSAVKISQQESYFVLVYVERQRVGSNGIEGNCRTDYDTFGGGTRIMIRTSPDGKDWSSPPKPVTPFAGELIHFNLMPNVACQRGTCNLIFYSTKTESETYELLVDGATTDKHWETNPFIEDFSVLCPSCTGADEGRLWYRRFLDIFSSKITFDSDGMPMPSEPVRVSKYQLDFDLSNPDVPVLFEKEWNPVNVLNYGGMTLPFIGDYIGLGISEWQQDPLTGEWKDNYEPIGPIDDAINKSSYFAAWTDNRRIRGNIYDPAFFDENSMTVGSLPFEIPEGTVGISRNDGDDTTEDDPLTSTDQSYVAERSKITEPGAPYVRKKESITERRPDRFLSAYAFTAEGVEDQNRTPGSCNPSGPTHASGNFQSRVKDSEIYGAIVEDREIPVDKVRLVSPTVAKNFTFIDEFGIEQVVQRGFVIGAQNLDPDPLNPRTLTLVIGNQPGVPPSPTPDPDVFLTDARASWRQLPFLFVGHPEFPDHPAFVEGVDPPPNLFAEVTIQALSTEYRTLFVISPDSDKSITVYAFDESGLVSQITVTGQSEAGDLIDPGTTAQNVLEAEIHNPIFIEPDWTTLETNLTAPNYKNPNFKNPNFKNTDPESPNFKNTDFMDPNYKNPNLKNPNFKNNNPEATSLINPNLKNPNFKNPNFKNTSFIDATYTVESNNNTTTAVNADFAFAGDAFDNLDIEVIAWQADELDSLQDCEDGLITETKVISAVSNPNFKNLAPADINNPFQGTVTFPLTPKGTINVTLRIFCVDDSSLEGCDAVKALGNDFVGYNVWSQAANTGKFQITDDEQELKDVLPPDFNLQDNDIVRAGATDSSGALVHLVDGTGTSGFVEFAIGTPVDEDGFSITATDEGTPTAVTCDLPDLGIEEMIAGSAAIQVPVGPTAATCSATDVNGIVGTWVGTLRVEDNTPPDLFIPDDFLTRTSQSASGANVNYLAQDAFESGTLTATDLHDPFFDPLLDLGCVPPSGSLFLIGNTPVNCTATDHGPNSTGDVNTATGSFMVKILDAEPPTFDGFADVREEATSADGATVDYPLPSASDNEDDDVTVACIDPPGTLFPLGSTPVSCKATDDAGNSVTITGAFNVIVEDTKAPAFDGFADVTEPAVDANGATVDYPLPSASDDVDDDVTVACIDPPGTLFPLGSTPVSCKATDDAGNSVTITGAFNVIVEDQAGPVLTLPTTSVTEATSPSGAVVTFSVSALDSVDGVVPVSCTAFTPSKPVGSGSEFPIGSTTVFCTATDLSGHTTPGQFTVTVVDSIAPVIKLNGVATMTLEAGVDIYTEPGATAFDAADDSVSVVIGGDTVDTLTPDTYVVTYDATDADGNEATTATRTVTVQDSLAPVITVPLDPLLFFADGLSGIAVDYFNIATDDVETRVDISVSDFGDPALILTCTPASGSTFAIGTTTVGCTATDGAGLTASASFTITVELKTGDGLSFGKNNVKAGSVVPFTWEWEDLAGTNISVEPNQHRLIVRVVNCSTMVQACEDIIEDEDGVVFFLTPGSSGIRLTTNLEYQANWQTVNDSTGDDLWPGDYQATIELVPPPFTEETLPLQTQISGFITIRENKGGRN